jgi:plastocyanin
MVKTQTVSTSNMAFNPNSVTVAVAVGDAVEWTNQMGVDHTVNPDNNEFPASGHIGLGKTFSHIFDASGTIAYHCEIHPFMKGTVIVT